MKHKRVLSRAVKRFSSVTRNHAGFTIVETLISLGLTATGALVIAQLLSHQVSSARNVQLSLSLSEISAGISLVLNDTAFCRNALGSKNLIFPATSPATQVDISDITLNGITLVRKDHIVDNVKTVALYLKNPPASAPPSYVMIRDRPFRQHMTQLVFVGQTQSGNNGPSPAGQTQSSYSAPSPLRTFTFPIQIITSLSSNKIVTCNDPSARVYENSNFPPFATPTPPPTSTPPPPPNTPDQPWGDPYPDPTTPPPDFSKVCVELGGTYNASASPKCNLAHTICTQIGGQWDSNANKCFQVPTTPLDPPTCTISNTNICPGDQVAMAFGGRCDGGWDTRALWKFLPRDGSDSYGVVECGSHDSHSAAPTLFTLCCTR